MNEKFRLPDKLMIAINVLKRVWPSNFILPSVQCPLPPFSNAFGIHSPHTLTDAFSPDFQTHRFYFAMHHFLTPRRILGNNLGQQFVEFFLCCKRNLRTWCEQMINYLSEYDFYKDGHSRNKILKTRSEAVPRRNMLCSRLNWVEKSASISANITQTAVQINFDDR